MHDTDTEKRSGDIQEDHNPMKPALHNPPPPSLYPFLILHTSQVNDGDGVGDRVRSVAKKVCVCVGGGGGRAESIATLLPFGSIEGRKWFVQISNQLEPVAFTSFGKTLFYPPAFQISRSCSTASGREWDGVFMCGL